MIACPEPLAASIRLRRHRAGVAATVTVKATGGPQCMPRPALIHARGRRSRSDLDSEHKRLILLHRGPGGPGPDLRLTVPPPAQAAPGQEAH